MRFGGSTTGSSTIRLDTARLGIQWFVVAIMAVGDTSGQGVVFNPRLKHR
jgi:hypothetical protein